MSFSAYQSAPVTQQAVVSVNAQIDRLFANHRKNLDTNSICDKTSSKGDDHVYTIQQRELCFRVNSQYDKFMSRPASNGMNDLSLKVFSSVNNFPCNWINMVSQNATAKLHDYGSVFSFAGVAQQPLDYFDKNSKDTLALQVGGSCTIYNTGTQTIRPGQMIAWAFPNLDDHRPNKRQISGEPLAKILVATIPADTFLSTDDGNVYNFVEYLMHAHAHVDETSAKTPEAKILADRLAKVKDKSTSSKDVASYLQCVLTMFAENNSRVIGMALSGATPGQQFDIMLNTHH